MKRLIYLAIFSLAITTSGCDGVMREVDWNPVILKIAVQDTNGTDLLNPTNDGFVGSLVTAEWNGNTYTYDHSVGNTTSRVYAPFWYGLFLQEIDGVYYLSLGEFAGDKEYDHDLIIRWQDGKKDVIHYKNRVNEAMIKASRTYSLNGKKCNNPIIIVR